MPGAQGALEGHRRAIQLSPQAANSRGVGVKADFLQGKTAASTHNFSSLSLSPPRPQPRPCSFHFHNFPDVISWSDFSSPFFFLLFLNVFVPGYIYLAISASVVHSCLKCVKTICLLKNITCKFSFLFSTS